MADERRTFDLSLVTPEGPAFEGEVEMLIVPGQDGEIGILARHAPLVATLKAGGTRVHIDRDRAQEQLDEARAELERLDRGESQADRWQVEQRLRHAENQLEVYSGGG